jgi:undecaprenyl diphosphate synthase
MVMDAGQNNKATQALGHESGTKSVNHTKCAKLAIENLTLYAFSTENWNRPKIGGHFNENQYDH